MTETRRFTSQQLGETFVETKSDGRLRCVYYEKPGFRHTFGLAIVRFGAADLVLPDGTPIPDGVAHFFEHRLFSKLDGDISRRFGALGMSVNASTGYSRTAYHFTGAGSFLAGVELLMELVFSPHFPAEGVEMERRIILREIAEAEESSAATKLFRNLHRALYHAHPVRRDILGNPETLAGVTPALLYRCHETYYCPENVVLFLYGGGAQDEARELIARCLAEDPSLPRGAAVPLAPVEEPDHVVEARVEGEHRIMRPQLAMGFKMSCSIPTGRAYLQETIATQVALDLVFGAGTEWFEEHYARSVFDDSFDASYAHDTGYGYACVSGETTDPEGFEETVRERIREVLLRGVDDSELQRVKRRIVGNYLRHFNSPEDALGLYANCYLVGASALDCAEVAAALQPADVESRLADIFAVERSSVSVLHPGSARRRP